MKLAPQFLALAAVTVALLAGHHPASASIGSYDGIAIPTFETQISLTDDSQLACHAFAPDETTADLF